MTLEDQIRAIVREELQRSASTSPALYTSRHLPPDVRSSATFNRACAAGLVLAAEKHGRSWVCTVEAWAEHRRSAARRAAVAKAPAPPTLLDELGAKRVAS